MKSLYLFTMFFLFTNIINAVPIDTGMIEWQQPNSVTFIAQMIGDEFRFNFTTNDGYEIREGEDGWFYYAILDENDNIVPSGNRVGIDEPLRESYNLELPVYKLAEIENYRQQFNQQLLEADEWFKQKRIEANGGTVTLKIGVILVDFADSVHYKSLGGNFSDGYNRAFFNNMIFSQNYWIGEPISPNFTTPHPENKQIFGSLRDYYNQQSCGKLNIIGKDGIYPEILNPPDPLHPDVPDWVYLDETKTYWNSQDILSTAEWCYKARQNFQQKFPNISLSNYDRIIYIYAGNQGTYLKSLWPNADPLGGFIMSEQWSGVYSHIGVHAHEFAHLLGADDEYWGDINVNAGYFDLMSNGNYNGPERKGECPAGTTPFNRIKWGWSTVTFLNEDSYQDILLGYNYQNPNYYRLDNPYDDTEYFLIENRLREGFDKWTPNNPSYVSTDPRDLNGNLGGMLIWTIDDDNGNHDKIGLISAGDDWSNSFAWVPFPFDRNPSGLNLTANTIPNNSIRNVSNSGVLIENIRWITDVNNVKVNINHDFSANYYVISSNQTWNDTRIIDKDLLIIGNATLTLQEGAVLKFEPQKKLQVLNTGALIIESSGNPVELTNNIPGQNWNGIELDGLVSVLQGSNYIISNANQAIKFQKSRNISFSNIRFENNLKTFSISDGRPTNPYQVDFLNCKISSSPIEHINTYIENMSLNLKNCVVENSIISTQGNINLTLVNNDFKSNSNITLSTNSTVKNNIFYNSTITNVIIGPSITYNCIYPYPQNSSIYSQPGNFSAEPHFSTSGNGSQLFEYSPCIDAGDPNDDFSNEPGDNGGRINIGSLGNTSFATQVNPFVHQVLSGSSITFLGNYFFKANSEWNINNSANVSANAQLIINPGVKLNFNSAATLLVKGTLNAQGLENNKITFDRIGSSGTWGNLSFKFPTSSNSILDNVEVKNGSGIMCSLSANVTIKNSIIDSYTEGVIVNSNGSLTISDSDINYAQIGIKAENGGSVSISNVTFNNCVSNGIALLGFHNEDTNLSTHTPIIKGCSIIGSATGISAVNSSEVVIKDNSISQCNLGIYLNQVNSAYITSNTILGLQSGTGSTMPGIFMSSSGGFIRNNTIRFHSFGALFAYSSPVLGVNTIENNSKCGIYVDYGSYPNLVQQLANPNCWYPVGGCNVIRNNGTYTGNIPSTPGVLPDGAEIFLYSGDVLLSYGYNEISDDRTDIPDYLTLSLIKGTRSSNGARDFFVDRNYWGVVGPSPSRFGTLEADYEPTAEYCPLPEAPCSGSELIIQTTDGQIIDTLDSRQKESSNISILEETYATADKLFYSGEIEEAKTYYLTIVQGNYTNVEKLYAYNKLYEIGELLKEGAAYFAELQNACNSILEIETDTLLLKAFNQRSILCDVSKEEYETAISKFDNIIHQNPNSQEAVYAEIDIITTALNIDTTGSGLGKIVGGKYHIKGTSDYLAKLNDLLQNKFLINSEDQEQEIPKEYSLNQNYPNPFNPNTTIRYQIPKNGIVTLKIYDVLGAEIATLVNEQKDAGKYEVNFNASRLASGVYIYKLQAGDFVSSKKMILLK